MSLVDKITAAIAKEEGYFNPQNLPNKLNNPGDLNFAGQVGATPFTEPGRATPYAHFSSIDLGIVALYKQVWLDIGRGQSLQQLIENWAPAADGNNPTSYLANVQSWTGITDATTPLLGMVANEWLGK